MKTGDRRRSWAGSLRIRSTCSTRSLSSAVGNWSLSACKRSITCRRWSAPRPAAGNTLVGVWSWSSRQPASGPTWDSPLAGFCPLFAVTSLWKRSRGRPSGARTVRVFRGGMPSWQQHSWASRTIAANGMPQESPRSGRESPTAGLDSVLQRQVSDYKSGQPGTIPLPSFAARLPVPIDRGS